MISPIVPVIFGLLWYILGAWAVIHDIRKDGDFLKCDITAALVGGLAGPTLWLLYWLNDLSKNKTILFKKYDKKKD